MRFARHQQHAQFVAHAVDRHHGAIVDQGQLIGERRGLDLDDIGAGMRDRNFHADVATHAHHALLEHFAVAPDRHLHGAAAGTLILDAEADGLRLADNAEARRLRQHDAAVDLVAVACDQRVQRRTKAQCGGVGRNVVDAAVGNHDSAGDAIRRHVGERRRQCGKQPGAVGLAIGGAGFGDAHLEAGNTLEPLDDRRARRVGLHIAVGEILARALVDNDGGDRRDRLAVLARE